MTWNFESKIVFHQLGKENKKEEEEEEEEKDFSIVCPILIQTKRCFFKFSCYRASLKHRPVDSPAPFF